MSHSERTVTVTGHGSTSAVPDTAVVRVAAIARAQGVAAAFSASSRAAAQIGATARRHTDETRIATSGINVWAFQDHQADNLGDRRGFEARHSMAIGCPDLDAAGALLEELAATVGDALAVEGIELAVADTRDAHDRAVAAAFDDAQRQASQLAALAGAALGEVLAIGPAPAGGAWGQGDALEIRSAKIEPGETTISASLSVTWALA